MPQLNHDKVLTNTLVKEIVAGVADFVSCTLEINFQRFFQDCDGLVLF
jgi:hypothetical protein